MRTHALRTGEDGKANASLANASYEWKAVTLLAFGFGMVGLDRFIIYPLFPVMREELGLNYQDLGLISAVLALGWGVASVFCGGLSDRLGRKRVLVPAIILFSLFVGLSGFATGLASLLLIRGFMGLAEGAYVPASIVATIEASKPNRIGLNVGLQQMTSPLVGSFLGPLIAVGLLKVLPSWHWVFVVVAVPGLIIALLMALVLRDSRHRATAIADPSGNRSWRGVMKLPAVWANTASMCCFLTCLMVLATFMPNYLTDHLKLSLDSMSTVLASLGAGGCVGMILAPAISDYVGRKIVMVAALVIALAAFSFLPTLGPEPIVLSILLFVAVCMVTGALAINVGPLTHGSVPAIYVTTATGVVVGVGEIFGGALAPALAGATAQRLGIGVVPWIVIASCGLALLIVALTVREPRPQVMSMANGGA
jgi:predicted MFS family arabinose efflux permease